MAYYENLHGYPNFELRTQIDTIRINDVERPCTINWDKNVSTIEARKNRNTTKMRS